MKSGKIRTFRLQVLAAGMAALPAVYAVFYIDKNYKWSCKFERRVTGMNSKHCRSILSILICMTMVLTQMAPLSFADTVSPSDGQAAGTDISVDQAEASEDDSSVSEATDTENDSAEAVTSDVNEKGGTAGLIDSIKDGAANLFDTDASESTGESEKTEETVTEPEEDLNPEISWYLNNTTGSVFEISNADQLRGLAKLVNGTAVQVVKGEDGAENTTKTLSSNNFSGKTIKLTADIDLEDKSWTPIGVVTTTYASSNKTNFCGTFDGDGHTVNGLNIDDAVWADNNFIYAGFFGCVSNGTVENVTINGKMSFTKESTTRSNGYSKTVYIGGAVSYAYNTVTIKNVNTDIDYTGVSAVMSDFGGIVSYMYRGSLSDCMSFGTYDIDELTLGDSNAAAGGIIGVVGNYNNFQISSCISNLDITSSLHYIGGIIGYRSQDSTTVRDCTNNGDLKARPVPSGSEMSIGGIVGYTSTGGSNDKISNVVNNGNIETVSGNGGKTSFTVNAGGIAGWNYKSAISNAYNTGNIIIPYNDESVKINASGLVGALDRTVIRNAVSEGSVIYKDYNTDSDDNIAQLCAVKTDYVSQGGYLIENVFCAENKASSLPLIKAQNDDSDWLDTVTSSVGVIKKNNIVAAYGNYGLMYDTNSLGKLLNSYVINHADSASMMRLWTLSEETYIPDGGLAASAASPVVTLSAKKAGAEEYTQAYQLSAPAGIEITLKADINVNKNESGESEITYQWYSSHTLSTAAAEAIEGASGKLDDLSGSVTYTIPNTEKSDLYYFVKVTNTVYHTDGISDEVITTTEKSADSSSIEIEFTQAIPECETAESFESGEGTSESPYIIATAQQLKLMQAKVNSTEEADSKYKAASYKLKNDIDFGGALWTPAGGSTEAAAFAGTFDGAGYKISGLNITASDGVYAGLFGYVNNAVIKNLTIAGSMNVKNTKYAGGYAAYLAGNTSLTDLVNEMNIKADSVLHIGGIAGYAANTSSNIKVINCINSGNIVDIVDNSSAIYGGTSSYVDSYAAGILAGSQNGTSSAYAYTVYNCVNTGDVMSDLRRNGTRNIRMWTAGIITPDTGFRYIKVGNSINYGKISQTGSINNTSAQPVMAGSYTNMDNCYDMTDNSNDADAVIAKLNAWTIDKIASNPGSRSWTKSESGILYPYGSALEAAAEPAVTLSIKTGDGSFEPVGADIIKVKAGTAVSLKAEISVSENTTGDSKLTYEWHKADTADKKADIVIASGELADISGESEQNAATESYSESYYYIKVTNTVYYAKSGYDVSAAVSKESDICGITVNTESGAYEGEVSESLEGSGTADEPYLIKSAADLKFMQQQVNAGTTKYVGKTINYKLMADIDLNNVKWTAIGQAGKAFQGIFDGNDKTIKNLNAVGYDNFSGLFGFAQNAEIKNLTVHGVINAEESAHYIGGIAADAYTSHIINCKSYVNITVSRCNQSGSNITKVGGITGYMYNSVAVDCVNNGSVIVTNNKAQYGTYIGGLVGHISGTYTNKSDYQYKSLLNSYNTGDVKIIISDAATSSNSWAGGIAGMLDGVVQNCMNSGAVSEAAAEGAESASSADYIGGIAGQVNSTSKYIEIANCVSYGNVSSVLDKAHTASGATVTNAGKTTPVGVHNSYAVACLGIDKVFTVAETTNGWSYSIMPQSENGYINPETGAITCGTFSAAGVCTPTGSSYLRSESVKTAMGNDARPEIYFALNTWAGNNNSEGIYNSWINLEGTSVYAPAGDPEKSPFVESGDNKALTLSIANSDAYEDTFAKDAVVPAMTTKLEGTAAALEGGKYIYSWYKSTKESMADSTLLENTSEDGTTYTVTAVPGRYYYSVDVTAVSGAYFKTVSAKPVKVVTEASFWTGEVADIEELAGYGTEKNPYIIDTPEKLALIGDYLIKNGDKAPTGREEYPDDSEDADKQAVSFLTAYFKITQDLDMGGTVAFKPIGGTAFATGMFKGHIYGEKESGEAPVIKNLYMSSDNKSAYGSYVGLVGFTTVGASIENLTFENVKIEMSPSVTHCGVIAGRMWGGAVRNITVSGEITYSGTAGSEIYTGGIAGEMQAVDVENCINRVNISLENVEAASSYKEYTGGITGYVRVNPYGSGADNTTIKNCLNEGTVDGGRGTANTAAAGGIVGNVTAGTGTFTFENNKNTGAVTGAVNVGGIVGYLGYGNDTTGYVNSCYNTGSVSIVNNNASGTVPAYIGGIAGKVGTSSVTSVKLTDSYNTGNITVTAEGNEADIAAGTVIGKALLIEAEDLFATAQDGLETVGKCDSDKSIVDADTVTSDELASTETAIALGSAFYQKAGTAPVLGTELDDADKCTVAIQSADNTKTAYIKSGKNLVTSLNAVKGASVSFSTAADLGYEVTSLKNGETVLTPADGIYTVQADSSLTLTASIGKAASTAVIVNDYQATPEGKILIAYRMKDKLADGKAVYLGDKELVHASAFDNKVFIMNTGAAGNVTIASDETQADDPTYVAFVDENTTLEDIASQITIKDESSTAVDYNDCDILGDEVLDVFDAQLVWDLAYGRQIIDASDVQRFQADLNKDGAITAQDVLMVHKAIINSLKSSVDEVIG